MKNINAREYLELISSFKRPEEALKEIEKQRDQSRLSEDDESVQQKDGIAKKSKPKASK